MAGKADYFGCKGVVAFIKKDNLMYKACPSAECNKKVVEVSFPAPFANIDS